MPHQRPAFATHWRLRFSRFFLSVLATMLVAMAGCFREPPPERVYERISSEINRGDLRTALLDTDNALLRYGVKSQEWSWRFRVVKAQILISQFAPKEALDLLKGEVPSEFATRDFAVRKVLFEGIARRVAQEFAAAEKKFAEAEHLAASFQPQLTCEVLNARGALEIAEKKYRSAEETLHRALVLSRQQENLRQQASVLLNLALVATSQEHYDEAVDRNQEALQLSRSLGMQSLVATILGNLGWAYFEVGDFENALDLFKQAAEASEKLGFTGHALYWLAGVVNSYEAMHDYASAEEIAKHTLKQARVLHNSLIITQCLNDLARLSLRFGRLDEAGQYNREAVKMEEAGLDHLGLLESTLISARIQTEQYDFAQAGNLFKEVLRAADAETLLRWQAEAGLAKLHAEQGFASEAEREYRKSIDTIEAARASINRDDLRLSFLSGAIEFYDDYIDFLIRHNRFADALRVAELSRARTLEEGLAYTVEAASLSQKRVRPQQIAQKLRASLLFYWIGHNHSYLWVITPSETAYFKLPKASEIEPVVKSYRKALLGMHDAQDAGGSDGKRLYAMLVEPTKKLAPPGSRVVVLPSESLYGLNFETLIVPDPKPHFWIEDVTVTTADSLTLLFSSQLRPGSRGENILLIGNTEQPNEEFPVLSPLEMQKIEGYFPDSNRKVLEGKQATPSAYLGSNPERFSYLHFATHGTASHTRPLESAVILSKEGDSYKLYGRDIVQHHLNARLVTMSACNGAGTRAYSGEGLVGLSWAFLRAGAHNVIAALWEVSDSSSPQLMDSLYRGLRQGKDPATALRDAKLSMLHSSSNILFKKPFYWAPFQLYAGS